MKVGLTHVNSFAVDSVSALDICKFADKAGFDSIWGAEHVVIPDEVNSPYPYSPDGSFTVDRDTPIPDPLIWLAYAAAAAPRLEIGTCILIVPQRNPVVLAKELATLDVLSGGKFELGLGIGWMKEEYDALGVDWARRGARNDEYIEAMKKLWSAPSAEYHGDFVDFTPVTCSPRPVNGSIPILAGGDTDLAMNRAIRIADGYYPGEMNPDVLKALLEKFRRKCEEAGRDPSEIAVSAMFVAQVENPEAGIEFMREIGVDRIMIPSILFRGEGGQDRLQALAEKIVPLAAA